MRGDLGNRWQRAALYGACYLAWVAFAAGLFWCVTRLRDVLLVLFVMAGASAKLIVVLDRFGIVLMGLAWIIGIGALESYLRSGLHSGKLGHHSGRVAAAEAGFLLFSYLLQWALLFAVAHV
jgi:hypothetical protein